METFSHDVILKISLVQPPLLHPLLFNHENLCQGDLILIENRVGEVRGRTQGGEGSVGQTLLSLRPFGARSGRVSFWDDKIVPV